MFKCGICNSNSVEREKAVRVVMETRTVEFPAREAAHDYKDREGTRRVKADPGGVGTQIVHEVLAHKSCAAETIVARRSEQAFEAVP